MAYEAIVGGSEARALEDLKAQKVKELDKQTLTVVLNLVRDHASSMQYAYRHVLVNIEREIVRLLEAQTT